MFFFVYCEFVGQDKKQYKMDGTSVTVGLLTDFLWFQQLDGKNGCICSKAHCSAMTALYAFCLTKQIEMNINPRVIEVKNPEERFPSECMLQGAWS